MAFKEINIEDMDEDDRKAAKREAKIMEFLDHPNVVKCYEVYSTKKKLCIVMDLADGGDLDQQIKKKKA